MIPEDKIAKSEELFKEGLFTYEAGQDSISCFNLEVCEGHCPFGDEVNCGMTGYIDNGDYYVQAILITELKLRIPEYFI